MTVDIATTAEDIRMEEIIMKIHTKRRKANNNEPWIGELLDEVSEDKLLEMSAIPTDIPLPLPNQEKLARTVIDKADVFDEQERERRKQYEKALLPQTVLAGNTDSSALSCAHLLRCIWVAYSTMFCWITTIIG